MPTITPENLLLVTLLAANLILLVSVLSLSIKIRRLLRGKNAATLEDTINHLDSKVKDISWFKGEMESYLKTVEARIHKSIQGIETVRFDAFKGIGEGGKQSFATALLNEMGDGVVVSSIYSRERTSIFGKPIKNLKSEHGLSEEEKEALGKANASIKSQAPSSK